MKSPWSPPHLAGRSVASPWGRLPKERDGTNWIRQSLNGFDNMGKKERPLMDLEVNVRHHSLVDSNGSHAASTEKRENETHEKRKKVIPKKKGYPGRGNRPCWRDPQEEGICLYLSQREEEKRIYKRFRRAGKKGGLIENRKSEKGTTSEGRGVSQLVLGERAAQLAIFSSSRRSWKKTRKTETTGEDAFRRGKNFRNRGRKVVPSIYEADASAIPGAIQTKKQGGDGQGAPKRDK